MGNIIKEPVQNNEVEIYVYDDMGHPMRRHMDKNKPLFPTPYLPDNLWSHICMHVPDYRDSTDNRKGIRNKKMRYVVDNITYVITYEVYVEDE